MIRSRLAVLLASALLAAPSAGGPEWEVAKQDDGILVERREVAGSKIREVRGTVEIQASVEYAASLFEAVETYTDWFDRCVEATELTRTENVSTDVYLRFDMPWPLSDRDVGLHVRRTEHGPQRAVYEGERKAGLAPRRDGVVRMPRLETRWVFEALPSGIRVTLYQHSDPGGSIPKWAVNLVTVDIPFNTLRGFRRRLE